VFCRTSPLLEAVRRRSGLLIAKGLPITWAIGHGGRLQNWMPDRGLRFPWADPRFLGRDMVGPGWALMVERAEVAPFEPRKGRRVWATHHAHGSEDCRAARPKIHFLFLSFLRQ